MMTVLWCRYRFEVLPNLLQKVIMEISKIVPTKSQMKIIELARNVSLQSTYGDFRHGAVLHSKSNILNVSPNQNKFSSFAAMFNKNRKIATLHAEISCILNQNRETTQNSTVCVVRVNKKGQILNSKPCEMCQAAMQFVGIKECIYSCDSEGNFEKMRF